MHKTGTQVGDHWEEFLVLNVFCFALVDIAQGICFLVFVLMEIAKKRDEEVSAKYGT
jgi:hypothetical protein